jgi:hypothetical protein
VRGEAVLKEFWGCFLIGFCFLFGPFWFFSFWKTERRVGAVVETGVMRFFFTRTPSGLYELVVTIY